MPHTSALRDVSSIRLRGWRQRIDPERDLECQLLRNFADGVVTLLEAQGSLDCLFAASQARLDHDAALCLEGSRVDGKCFLQHRESHHFGPWKNDRLFSDIAAVEHERRWRV